MAKKDTYEELEERVKELENELHEHKADHKQAEEALRQSKERYRQNYQNTPAMLYSIDSTGKIIDVSDYWLKKMGYEREEVIGRLSTEFLTPESQKYAKEIILPEYFKTGICNDIEYQFVRKDGTIMDVLLSANSEKDAEGNFIRSLAIINDVTERKKAEEALRESEERFRQLAEGTFEAIVLHEKGVILEANEQFYEMIGYNPEELTGKDVISLTTTPESAEKVGEQIALGNLGPYEITGVKKDGTKFPMESRIKLIEYKGRKVRMAARRDLTERKKGETALKKRTRELELQKKSLEELNTAMKVLLKKREEDKTEVEQNVMANVRELISPYFDKINKTKLDDHQKAFLNILESNLNEIVSPFTRKLSLKYLSLTPKEIQIVNMIKIGYPSKKIAKIM